MVNTEVLRNLLDIVKRNNLSAKNKSKWDGISLCLNIIEIPEKYDGVSVSLLLVSVLGEGRRRNALPPNSFSHIMREIEGALDEVVYDIPVSEISEFLCTPLVNQVTDYWYRVTRAHRIFLIPTISIFDFINRLSNKDNIDSILNGCWETTLDGIVIYIKTETCKSTIKFESEE